MTDDLNPVRPEQLPEDALVKAFDELIEERSSRAESPDSDAYLAAYLGSSAEASPEEAAEVARLASASRDWQHKLAVRLAATPRRGAHRPGRFYMWAGAGLAASLILTAGLVGWWRLAHTPERLLAEAYTHSRIFDLRMPGAGFAEVTPQAHLRGSDTGRESASLLDARARIEGNLENAPEDRHWLQLEARADVLEEKFDPAIDILDRLLAAGPVTAGLLADDATAYFQRGVATGSENDRATALENLCRADELAPDDPLILFNEAIVMEDRGQLMNAVETWNRYLQFERDPLWLAAGRRRLQALEGKLKQMKTHQSRLEQHLATPADLRALAADPDGLAAVDEELSSTLLPQVLDSAYPMDSAVPMPVDRSRGSPSAKNCLDNCLAARTLLHALAISLKQTHRDSWLSEFLPPPSSFIAPNFIRAAHSLAQAISADVEGDYLAGRQKALQATQLFHALGNTAGEERAQLELSYALQRGSNYPACYRAVHPLLSRNPQFAYIQIYALTQDTLCDSSPGTGSENNPTFLRAVSLAHDAGYTLLELRARNLLGAAAVDTGDSEAAWQVYLPTVRRFYSGDYPPTRLYSTLSGLEEVERTTPRVHLHLLMQREVVRVLEMSESRQLIPTERFNLAAAAIRVGSIDEAQEQMRLAQSELADLGGGVSVQGFLAENEMAMADLYLDRHDLAAAAKMLDSANEHMAGEQNTTHRKMYAVERGQLDLVEGHAEMAEPLLRNAIVEEERQAGRNGAEGIVLAQQDRDLYALLAGVWLAQGRSSQQVLALWERYRLRILGDPAPLCTNKALNCLQPRISAALRQLGPDILLGQIVLLDRLLLYRASAQGVVWTSVPIRKEDVLAATEPLEREVSSPATPMDSVDRTARRAGELLLAPLNQSAPLNPMAAAEGQLLLEPDPVLGNLPWPSVETASGPIGLQFNLEELPSLALDRSAESPRLENHGLERAGSSILKRLGKPLVVGASVASTDSSAHQLLPEVLDEARAIARFTSDSDLLLADQATETQVVARLAKASAVHFAGHAAQQDGATRLLLAPENASASTNQVQPWLDSDLLRTHPPRFARLTVFSACSTGKKEEGWNHGMGDIVDTLASLGVPDVVATRWQIDSASAVPMMDAFYAGLAKGLTVPAALTAARKSLIRDPRYRHPYYWAAWYASGWGKSDLSQIFHTQDFHASR